MELTSKPRTTSVNQIKKMKKITCRLLVGALCLLALGPQTAANAQQLASRVDFYLLPTVLPNSDNTLQFGTVRDALLLAIKQGAQTFATAGTRVGTNANNIVAYGIRGVFDATDIAASTTTNLWMGHFNPAAPANTQYGNRPYEVVLAIARNGKVCSDRFSYTVSCGAIPGLGYSSSLSGLSNSVSRIGINAGPDGVLFTPDDVIANSGAGTNLYDAVVFIGGRCGALINSQSDMDNLNSYLSTPTWIRWDYYFNGATNVSHASATCPLYQGGQIPWNTRYNEIVPYIGPLGVLFSVVGQAGSTNMTLLGSRKAQGPYVTVTTTATEGTTAFWSFTRNATNDYGFYRLQGSNVTRTAYGPVVVAPNLSSRALFYGPPKPVTPYQSTELDQDN